MERRVARRSLGGIVFAGDSRVEVGFGEVGDVVVRIAEGFTK